MAVAVWAGAVGEVPVGPGGAEEGLRERQGQAGEDDAAEQRGGDQGATRWAVGWFRRQTGLGGEHGWWSLNRVSLALLLSCVAQSGKGLTDRLLT